MRTAILLAMIGFFGLWEILGNVLRPETISAGIVQTGVGILGDALRRLRRRAVHFRRSSSAF